MDNVKGNAGRDRLRATAIRLCLMLACLLCIASCLEEGEDIDQINKQTTIVFLPWSGTDTNSGLYNIFLENLDSIESAIIKARKMPGRVVVFISRSASHSDLYEITYDKGQILHTPIKSYEGTAYDTAEGITQILNDVKANAFALNYAMVIGCHGAGWTFKDDWQSYPYRAPGTRFFGSVSDMQYAIDITTLGEGIEGSGMKMQYILFDDCYMANVETAYQLRGATNFLIGSTSEVMAQGMPYSTMWSSLASATPAYETAVNAFNTFYASYSTPSGALSAVDCRKVGNLVPLMKMINSNFTISQADLDSVQVLDGFPTPMFYDLADYVARLCKNTDMLNDFNDQLAMVVTAKTSTDSLYTALIRSRFFNVRTNCGLTISDPSANPVALKGREKTAWWRDTH